jgi:hypothetical protein
MIFVLVEAEVEVGLEVGLELVMRFLIFSNLYLFYLMIFVI